MHESKPAPLTKADAARRQIETAIELTFNAGDWVAIHTLVSAANGILTDLCKIKGVQSSLDEKFDEIIKPEHKGDFRRHMNSYANFLKHADKDANETREIPADNRNDIMIFWGILRYRALGSEPSTKMHSFCHWYFSLHPNHLRDDYIQKANHEKLYEIFIQIPREAQAAVGRFMYLTHSQQESAALETMKYVHRKFPKAFELFENLRLKDLPNSKPPTVA